MTEQWRGRIGTARAMLALSGAQLLVAALPFRWWRGGLGSVGHSSEAADCLHALSEARRIARQVNWAAERLAVEVKCLPRAMALSWILRTKRIDHAVVFAVRPSTQRQAPDSLHAWVEIEGTTILGALPGPWLETLRLGR